MNPDQIRVTAITEMFLGLGQEPTPERVAYYARLLERVPPDVLREACDRAVTLGENGFPPGPGQILRAAVDIHEKRVKAQRKAWADEQWARVLARRAGGDSEE